LAVGFPRAPWPTPVVPDQIEMTGIGLFARQPALAPISWPRGGAGIQRGGIAPVWALLESNLPFVPAPPQPVPPVTFHLSKPGAAQARVGYHDRPAVRGQDRPQLAQRAPMRPGTGGAGQWIHFLIDRQRSTSPRHGCLEHQMFVARLT